MVLLGLLTQSVFAWLLPFGRNEPVAAKLCIPIAGMPGGC
jgi:hypothetical protein